MTNPYLNRVLDALFPQQCRLCRLPSASPLPLCSYCREALSANRAACERCALPLDTLGTTPRYCPHCLNHAPAFTCITAPYRYDPCMAYLVSQWKYRGERRLAALFARLWLDGVADLPEIDLLVAVPLHWSRLLRRGFNQADLLLHELRRASPQIAAIPADPRRLRKRRATSHQVGHDARQRRSNLAGAFTVKQRCDNLRVAVIEDVVTTGATASAVSKALSNAGAAEVHIWCLARTPPPEH